MIREFQQSDLEVVSRLWLDTNISTHNFIDSTYWSNQFEAVKEMLAEAEIYVYEEDKVIGFIGLDGNYIAGIFVDQTSQSKGVGQSLLDYAKERKKTLSLSVYSKNERAVNFYKKAGFKISEEGFDEETQESEYTMIFDQSKH